MEKVRAVPKVTYKRRKPKRSKRNAFSHKVKQQIYERDNGQCQQCGAPGTQIHHVKFRSQGGRGVYSNGVLLCHSCHRKVHDNRELALQWQKHFESMYGNDYYKDEFDLEGD